MDMTWVQQHYEVGYLQGEVPALFCRHCYEWVTYLTMHAVMRHADPIGVSTAVNRDQLLTLVW